MRLDQDYTFELKPGDLLSISEHGPKGVWLSGTDYGYRGKGACEQVNGVGFCIRFQPRNISAIRKLLDKLERLAATENKPAFQDFEAKWPTGAAQG